MDRIGENQIEKRRPTRAKTWLPPGIAGIRGKKTGWAFGLDTREVGGLGILAWNVVVLVGCWLGRNSDRLGAMMLLGLAGNVAVVLGWLGASAVERSLHGTPGDYTQVIALVLGQLAIGLVALAPAGYLSHERA